MHRYLYRNTRSSTVPMDEVQKKVLKALIKLNKPSGCGDIGKLAGLKVPVVVGKIRGLSKEGYVQSPVKGKYVVTDKGKTAVRQ